jgi:hypothetical protein
MDESKDANEHDWHGSDEGMSAQYRVGVAKADITPTPGVPYLGFAGPGRQSFFTGVHDQLFARPLYLSDGKEEFVLLSTDTFGFVNDLFGKGRHFASELRARITDATGVPGDRIMHATPHIHSAPETLNFRPFLKHSVAAEWLEKFMSVAASSAKQAKAQAFPATLRIGHGDLPGVSQNRRRESAMDDEVIVLFFEGDDGRNVVLMNFACHPVIVQVSELVSGDFVGLAETTVENVLPGNQACLFLQGACGDINPIAHAARKFQDRFEGVRWTGLALAGEVLKTVGRLKVEGKAEEPVLLRSASKTIDLPSRSLPKGQELEAIREKAKNGGAREMETVVRVEEGEGPFAAELQVLRIGGAALGGIPGEPFCRIGLEMKARLKPLVGVPVGYANGYLGYLAPPEAWAKGGYEVLCGPWSKVGPESFSMIQNTLYELFRQITDGK